MFGHWYIFSGNAMLGHATGLSSPAFYFPTSPINIICESHKQYTTEQIP